MRCAGSEPMDCLNLPVARYRLDFRVDTPLTLPPFAGSTLRGVFGSALRACACMSRATDCEGCPLLQSCSYAALFEPRPPRVDHPLQNFSQIPRPYVIEPPDWGEKTYARGDLLSFHLVLAGRATQQLPLILWAFHKALQGGVGKGDGRASLARVWHVLGGEDALILDGPEGRIADHSTRLPTAASATAHSVTLHFASPLRLQNNGRRATAEEFTPRRLLTTLMRRISLMHEFHGAGPLPDDFRALAALADTLASEKQLHWRDWARYSNRQQQKMDLGGVIGRWTLSGEIAPFLPFLHLGQWLHVGKETAFGLGGYSQEVHG